MGSNPIPSAHFSNVAFYTQIVDYLSVDFDFQKKDIEKRIVDKALSTYGQGKLTEDDLIAIADFTLEELKKVNSKEELLEFLSDISTKWSFFKEIAIIEQGEQKEAVEDEVYKDVLMLAKNGKVNDAIKLAKSVTEK